jgi:hypothetical protein
MPIGRISPILELIGDRKFDLIIIDGHRRVELAEASLDHLPPDGAMIFDNSESYGFQEMIRQKNCQKVDLYGFAPGVILRHCTSIVFINKCFLFDSSVPIQLDR